MSQITCPECGASFELDLAMESRIEAKVLKAEREKHEKELKKAIKQADVEADKKLKDRLAIEEKKREDALELERERIRAEIESSSKKQTQKQTLLIDGYRTNRIQPVGIETRLCHNARASDQDRTHQRPHGKQKRARQGR